MTLYTLQDLVDRKVICEYDGTCFEQLKDILDYCFPKNRYYADGKWKHYLAPDPKFPEAGIEMDNFKDPPLPVQSVQLFYKQIWG